jgi:hypothetical protein
VEVVAMARHGDDGRSKRHLEGYGEDGGRQDGGFQDDGGRWYQQDGPQSSQGYQGGFQDQRFQDRQEQRVQEP